MCELGVFNLVWVWRVVFFLVVEVATCCWFVIGRVAMFYQGLISP